MNVLLTGGAGYIGSHVAGALRSAGHNPVAYDNLVKGHRESVLGGDLIVADVADGQALRTAMKDYHIESVIHLAAFSEAGESVEKPGKYFSNNTIIGLTLLEAMRDSNVRSMVFSSTAAVYGTPKRVPICESDRLDPINPYGASKLCVEFMLAGYAAAHEMGFVSLRYFNVAGADPDGLIGEDHRPETHLIPLVLQVASGRRDDIKIFGEDYDTPDGTCIRDYIHVCDLADAHVLALADIEPGALKIYNLGNGEGYSVKQVIEACRKATGRDIPTQPADRRPGDPPRLVASSDKAVNQLGWKPKHIDLTGIVVDAWRWHQSHPEGYGQG